LRRFRRFFGFFFFSRFSRVSLREFHCAREQTSE
jgi:hypothetical protein